MNPFSLIGHFRTNEFSSSWKSIAHDWTKIVRSIFENEITLFIIAGIAFEDPYEKRTIWEDNFSSSLGLSIVPLSAVKGIEVG